MQESRWKPATMSFGLPTGCPPPRPPSPLLPPPHRLPLHHTWAVLLHLTLLVWAFHLVARHLVVGFQPPNSPQAPPPDTVAKLTIFPTPSFLLFTLRDKKPKEERDQLRLVSCVHLFSLSISFDVVQEQTSDDDEETFFDSETLPTPFGVVHPGQLTSPSSSCCPSDRESLAGDCSEVEEEEGWRGRTPTFHPRPHSPYYCPPSDGDVTPTR